MLCQRVDTCASKADCGCTTFHKYFITIQQPILFALFLTGQMNLLLLLFQVIWLLPIVMTFNGYKKSLQLEPNKFKDRKIK